MNESTKPFANTSGTNNRDGDQFFNSGGGQQNVMHHCHPSNAYIHAGSSMPQHLLPYSQSYVRNASDIFSNMKSRRGKWTTEEEEYANFLVRQFENGTVPDCENGCTLRAFLSRKLHCAPMRISKKFAGQSIGKHVFIARAASTFTSVAYESRRKLVELEQAFLSSVMSESPMFNYPVIDSKNVSNAGSLEKSNSSMKFEVPFCKQGENVKGQNLLKDGSTWTQNLVERDNYKIGHVQNLLRNGSLFNNQKRKVDVCESKSSNISDSNVFSHNVLLMSDFLAGFDKITKNNNDDNCNLKALSKPHTIPTTKSFDDFHKYLGRDIPTPPFKEDGLASKAVFLQFSQPAPDSLMISDQGLVEKSKNIDISSDEFAIFAQNSSLAVSHHSAYGRKVVENCVSEIEEASKVNKRIRTSGLTCKPNKKIIPFSFEPTLDFSAAPNNLPVVSGSESGGGNYSSRDTDKENTDNENDVSDYEGIFSSDSTNKHLPKC